MRALGSCVLAARSLPRVSRAWVHVLYLSRWPLVLSAVTYFLLSQPKQTQEMYQLFNDDGPRGWLISSAIAVLIFLLACVLLFSARHAHTAIAPRFRRDSRTPTVLIQILCPLGAIWGIQSGAYLASVGPFNDAYRAFLSLYRAFDARFPNDPDLSIFRRVLTHPLEAPIYTYPQLKLLGIVGFTMILAIVMPWTRRRIAKAVETLVYGKRSQPFPLCRTAFYRVILLLTVLLVATFALGGIFPGAVLVPIAISPLPLLGAFLALLTLHMAVMSEVGSRYRVSVPAVLICAALLFDALGWNNNHHIRSTRVGPDIPWIRNRTTLPDGTPPGVGWERHIDPGSRLPFLEEAFIDWLNARPAAELARYRESPYPVFIVAAEGGGIYAAAESSIFLARLFDQCPRLVHHVFAISGVSGGSLGAALVTSVLAKDVSNITATSEQLSPDECRLDTVPQKNQRIERQVKALLQRDYLSPVLAAGLFPDFLQRFIPYPVPAFDRTLAFESTMERSWDSEFPGSANPFSALFRTLWRSDGNVPMLLINTTAVEEGKQFVLGPVTAPYPSEGDPPRYFEPFFDDYGSKGVDPRYDIRLSTAVGLSARFPGVTPPGFFMPDDDPNGRRFRATTHFVDAGYVDNSGVETALSVAAALRWIVELGEPASSDQRYRQLQVPHIEVDVRVVMIGGVSPVTSNFVGSSPIVGEVLAPVYALMNARSDRAKLAVERSYAIHGSTEGVSLAWNFAQPPLGWLLSERSVELIAAQLGEASYCRPPQKEDRWPSRFTERTNYVARGPWDDRIGFFFEFEGILRANSCAAYNIIGAVADPSGTTRVIFEPIRLESYPQRKARSKESY